MGKGKREAERGMIAAKNETTGTTGTNETTETAETTGTTKTTGTNGTTETTETAETTGTTKTNGTTETELSQMSRSRMSCMSRVSRLREGWKTVKLGEVCEFLNGKTKPVDTGIIPIYGSNGIIGYSNRFLYSNAIIVGRVGAYAGALARCKTKFWPTDNTIVVKPREQIADTDFIFYRMKKLSLSSLIGGSAQPLITQGILKSKEFPLPPLPTQRKIAAVLGALDDKIENNRKICANLEAQAQALFKSWFVDFEPFGGKMPKDWKMGKLGDVCCVSRNTITPEEMPEIVEHYSLPAFDKNRLPSYEQSTTIKSNKFRVSKGSILISKLNPKIKRLWDPFVETECAISSTEFVVIEPKEEKVREFVYSVLDSKSFESYASSHAAGTTNSHQRISPEDILRYEIVLPTAEMLSRFSGFGKGLLAKRKELLKQSRALAELRDALLPKLMSGELDVSEVAV